MSSALTPALPSRPKWSLPADAADCHAHVFESPDRFPTIAGLSYAPPLAPVEAYVEMLDAVGVTRGVLVQPTVYGTDCSALVSALKHAGARVRGIGVTTSAISDAELAALHDAGIRGLRFIEMPDPSGGGGRYKGAVGTDELERLAPRLTELGWHAQVWAPAAYLHRELPRLLRTGVPIVLDHMGVFDVAKGLQDPDFKYLLDVVADDLVWMKIAVCRGSRRFPDYEDLRPFHDAVLRASPDRLVWGSDWPHVRMAELTPDVGHLVDLFGAWVADDTLRRKILVANPAALYGFG
jgi:predicted TIM-barrel fold metal-dependent hydrolase